MRIARSISPCRRNSEPSAKCRSIVCGSTLTTSMNDSMALSGCSFSRKLRPRKYESGSARDSRSRCLMSMRAAIQPSAKNTAGIGSSHHRSKSMGRGQRSAAGGPVPARSWRVKPGPDAGAVPGAAPAANTVSALLPARWSRRIRLSCRFRRDARSAPASSPAATPAANAMNTTKTSGACQLASWKNLSVDRFGVLQREEQERQEDGGPDDPADDLHPAIMPPGMRGRYRRRSPRRPRRRMKRGAGLRGAVPTGRRPAGRPRVRCYCCFSSRKSTRSRNSLPALKCGTNFCGTCTFSPDLGLRPVRGGR